MDSLVTIITPTGFRPEAFQMCAYHVDNQTYPRDKIQWIVVDDSETVEPSPKYELYQSPLLWRRGYNTQRFGIGHVLSKVKGDFIFFFEDDDYYASTFIEEYAFFLEKFQVVGEGNAKYYHLTSKTYQEQKNYEHTSLAALGFRRDVIPFFEEALHSGDKFFDITFWKIANRENLSTLIFTNRNLSIGLKGMPGRKGIGSGHSPEGYTSDPFSFRFREWLGDAADLYSGFTGNKVKK